MKILVVEIAKIWVYLFSNRTISQMKLIIFKIKLYFIFLPFLI